MSFKIITISVYQSEVLVHDNDSKYWCVMKIFIRYRKNNKK